MLCNYTVGIYNKSQGQKIDGVFVPGALTWIKNIDCDIQPYSKELLLKDFGYNIEVNKRVFINQFDSNIKIGTILKYTDKYNKKISMEVKAIPWDDGYMEVMCLVI